MINVFHPHIGFLIKLEKIITELIITAYGNPYLFKSVELLYKYSPIIKNWKITVFVQPSDLHSQYEAGNDQPFYYYGIELKISQIYFIAYPNDNNPYLFPIDLYIPIKSNSQNQNIIRGAVYIILEHLLGEKAFVNEINYIHIHHCNPDDQKRAYPLSLLLKYIKDFKYDIV